MEKPGSHPDLGDFDLDHHRHHHRHHHHHGLHHDDQEGNPSTRSHSCLGDIEKNRYNKDLFSKDKYIIECACVGFVRQIWCRNYSLNGKCWLGGVSQVTDSPCQASCSATCFTEEEDGDDEESSLRMIIDNGDGDEKIHEPRVLGSVFIACCFY